MRIPVPSDERSRAPAPSVSQPRPSFAGSCVFGERYGLLVLILQVQHYRRVDADAYQTVPSFKRGALGRDQDVIPIHEEGGLLAVGAGGADAVVFQVDGRGRRR